ncbi:hypothetical protein AH715_005364 [Salmonella enterica subsp. enterica]|nr:hypothetical protein [Salmonella enterica subsp. enterica]
MKINNPELLDLIEIALDYRAEVLMQSHRITFTFYSFFCGVDAVFFLYPDDFIYRDEVSPSNLISFDEFKMFMRELLLFYHSGGERQVKYV